MRYQLYPPPSLQHRFQPNSACQVLQQEALTTTAALKSRNNSRRKSPATAAGSGARVFQQEANNSLCHPESYVMMWLTRQSTSWESRSLIVRLTGDNCKAKLHDKLTPTIVQPQLKPGRFLPPLQSGSARLFCGWICLTDSAPEHLLL